MPTALLVAAALLTPHLLWVAPAHALSVSITSLTSPVYRGDSATAQAKSSAGSRCSIVVTYKSGPSKAKGLEAKTVNSKGRVAWTWKVGTNTTPGKWPVKVSCSKSGASANVTKKFEVRR